TSMKAANVRFLLKKLLKEGAVENPTYGKYRAITDSPPNEQRAEVHHPERREKLKPLAAILNAWKAAIGVNQKRSLDHVIEMANPRINPELNAAFLAVAAMDDGITISNVLLARWLREYNEVPTGGLMLSGGGVDEKGSPWWTLVPAS